MCHMNKTNLVCYTSGDVSYKVVHPFVPLGTQGFCEASPASSVAHLSLNLVPCFAALFLAKIVIVLSIWLSFIFVSLIRINLS